MTRRGQLLAYNEFRLKSQAIPKYAYKRLIPTERRNNHYIVQLSNTWLEYFYQFPYCSPFRSHLQPGKSGFFFNMFTLKPFMLTYQKLYAKALYDNVADSPDELAFRKGDILAVIEQDTDGLVGWWLCTLRGRQI
uniref:SH3 domain-containing protein n=1 Tax=Glossina pallidipes TaxID=7398 RepID=A0A1B0AET5_GLOPL